MMKKYLMMGLAAMAIASCSNNDSAYDASRDKVHDTYNAAFRQYVGVSIAPNQTWGFGPNATRGLDYTRSVSVNGDVYSKFPSQQDVAGAFPTSIPANADEVSQLETLYAGKQIQDQWGNTQTMYGIYQIYQYKIVEGYNLKVTSEGTYGNNVVELGGNYQNAGWNGTATVAYPYNVYVNVDGNLTIRRVGATHFNLYILKGNVTLESNYGEQAGLISVASGATLNDGRNSIAANQGVKLYNRGTVNANNTEKYDIGNFCTVYNEGKFNVSGALTYSPGDANDSYFMNFGDDAELTAPSMTLNSTGNFFNDGKVNISGETNVTQARLYWVNAGHYTTGSITFSAKNCTFFNYCQLLVGGNAHMYDGEFNMMTNSYTEAGSAELDNFFINMYGNTGMYIKGNVDIKAQGDGTFQGFKNKDNQSNKYVLVDGKVTIASHKQTLSIQSGITYSFNQMEIVKGGNVVTEEYLQSIGDGDYPVTVLEGTDCPHGKLTVTPNSNSCGATWKVDKEEPSDADIRVICEDLSASDATDFDFNDVVFDVKFTSATSATVTIVAAGGTLPLEVAGHEVHEAFGVTDKKTMINTQAGRILTEELKNQGYKAADGLKAQSFTVDGIDRTKLGEDIPVRVQKNGEWYTIEATVGGPTAKIGVAPRFVWPNEKQSIKSKYEGFTGWVTDPTKLWY